MSDIRYAYPAYRVFIYGIEVSEDVVSVNLTYHDGSAPNQCQISLLNELDKYVINTNDITAIKDIDKSKLNVPWIKDGHIGSAHENAPDMRSGVKYRVLSSKNIIKQDVPYESRLDITGKPLDSPGWTNYFGTEITKYPICDGSSIFHPMDPVRVFFRDPFNPNDWYHMFCGFVSDIVESSDHNNVSTLNIVVEDPTKLFRFTRVVFNPAILDANKVVADNDIRIQSFWSNAMYDMSLPEAFYTLIFGPDGVGDTGGTSKLVSLTDSQSKDFKTSTRLHGIGHFNYNNSVIATVGPSDPNDSVVFSDTSKGRDIKAERIKSLAREQEISTAEAEQLQSDDNQNWDASFSNDFNVIVRPLGKTLIHLGNNLTAWQALLDHKVTYSDLRTMEAPKVGRIIDFPTYSESGTDTTQDIEKVIQYIGSRPDQYPVDGGRLMMLIPRRLGAENNNVLLRDILQAYPVENSTFINVGQVLYEMVDTLQFSMYCSPRGDIVVEPPLVDFDPSDFGMTPVEQYEESIKGSIDYDSVATAYLDTEGQDMSILGTGPTRSAKALDALWKGADRYNDVAVKGPYGPKYIVSDRDTISIENAWIDDKVYTMASAKHAIVQNMPSIGYSDMFGGLSTVIIPELVPLYGSRAAPLTPRGYISSMQAANLYAHVCLNRLNADAHTIRVTHIPNINMWVNRPIYVQNKNVIATTKRVTHNITWGRSGNMSTNIELYSTRSWNGDVDSNGRMIYTNIGGYGSKLLNYAMLFGVAPKSVPQEEKPVESQFEGMGDDLKFI